jgi:diadenosine tetraphosphate (Ap4A) HIT family hydrolase
MLQAIQKHLIIAIGQKCYLSLPVHQSLVVGHCLIVPRTHVTCSTQLDEDVWAEMQVRIIQNVIWQAVSSITLN